MKREQQFDLTWTMTSVWSRLLSDLGQSMGNVYENAHSCLLNGDMAGFRASLPQASPYVGSAYDVKVRCQLNGFFDRFITQHDQSDALLEAVSLKAVVQDQARIATYKEYSTKAKMVIQEARKLLKEILGEYSVEEHLLHCRFGKKAAIGSSYSRSSLDEKLVGNALTGSSEHITWFVDYLKSDNVLVKVLRERTVEKQRFVMCDQFTQAFVPKNWKKKRGIVKNTLIGTFYTYGLGKLIELRLKKHGHNIKKLQRKHKRLAKRGSKTGRIATADLSAASDSITTRLILALLPRKWWRALNFGRTRKIGYTDPLTKEQSWFRTETFSGMGNGFTFTLQTLVFYCLIKAIGKLLGVRGTYSTYGDDLIYPVELHPFVVTVFTELGFKLNQDKTYATGQFRESCGGDYFAGVDVRPTRPEGEYTKHCSKKFFQSFMYKVRNGLLRRWSEFELPKTLAFIDTTVARLCGELHLVPPLYPDNAGVRSSTPEGSLPWYLPVSKPKYNLGLQHWTFTYLREQMGIRRVISENPYYWDILRASVNRELPRKWSLTECVSPVKRGFRISWQDKNDITRSYLTERKPRKAKLKGKTCERVTIGIDRSYQKTSMGRGQAITWPLASFKES